MRNDPAAGAGPLASEDANSAGESWRAEAAALYPRRASPGPIDVGMALQAAHPELLPRYWALGEAAGHAFYDAAVTLQYWADGTRSVAEIADLVALEMGYGPNEHALAYFRLLAEGGLIVLDSAANGQAAHE